jgi:hypothetical protein
MNAVFVFVFDGRENLGKKHGRGNVKSMSAFRGEEEVVYDSIRGGKIEARFVSRGAFSVL